MKTFTIDAENNITVHTSKKAAKETGASVFATEGEFAELIGSDGKRLIAIWNSLPAVTPVKKFKDCKTGVARIWKQIQGLGEVAAVQSEAAVPEPQPVEVPSAPEMPTNAEPQDSGASENEGAPIVEPAPAPPVPSEAQSGETAAPIAQQVPEVAPEQPTATKTAPKAPKRTKAKKAAKAPETNGPREGSKTSQVVEMLKREGGATLTEIMAKMGWQKHTVRGFMAGTMKKAGYTVESFKPEGGERTYRINK